MRTRLPPTSGDLAREEARPYFLWWTDCTVGQLRQYLASPDPEESAYWLGALVREANSRDVWLFTSPAELRRRWSEIVRYLGSARAMWAWLLDIPETHKPQPTSAHAR